MKNTWRDRRQQRCETLRERNRRRIREPAEHHVRQWLRELRRDHCADVRVVVAVARGPPRCDAIDESRPSWRYNRTPSVRTTDEQQRRIFICRYGSHK